MKRVGREGRRQERGLRAVAVMDGGESGAGGIHEDFFRAGFV